MALTFHSSVIGLQFVNLQAKDQSNFFSESTNDLSMYLWFYKDKSFI